SAPGGRGRTTRRRSEPSPSAFAVRATPAPRPAAAAAGRGEMPAACSSPLPVGGGGAPRECRDRLLRHRLPHQLTHLADRRQSLVLGWHHLRVLDEVRAGEELPDVVTHWRRAEG